MVKEITIVIGLLIIFFAPFVAIGWIIYRLIKGSGGNKNSIIGD